ncbi:MAG: hypothetical protein O2821_05310 [Chloroflexi bacterium]|nr:hypothetical protein [Chloroflexota bacterium]MDA1228530.1 hypothetical protein [Chloroflexota bacterium]
MTTTEHTINDALAEVLKGTRSLWRPNGVVESEKLGAPRGNSKRPDVLVVEPGVSPVVVETEVMPALTVEQDALSRLGERLSTSGAAILSSLAVRMPVRFRDYSGASLQGQISGASDLEMALYTGGEPGGLRQVATVRLDSRRCS